jgi:hypothetical protein
VLRFLLRINSLDRKQFEKDFQNLLQWRWQSKNFRRDSAVYPKFQK